MDCKFVFVAIPVKQGGSWNYRSRSKIFNQVKLHEDANQKERMKDGQIKY